MRYRIIGKKIIASLIEISGLEKLLFSAPTEPKVLMYHRIIDPVNVPYPLEDGMYVCPETLQIQMNYLAGQCNVIGLDELATGIIEGRKFLPRTIAITFDDGWVDNYLYAYPIIKKLSLPATIFLTTGFIGSNKLLWTDKVAVFLQAICGGQTAKQSVAKLPPSMVETDSLIVEVFHNFVEAGDYKNIKDAISYVLKSFKGYSVEQLDGIMTTLSICFAAALAEAGRAFLTWDEVREMAANGISFGSHSGSHLNLTKLDHNQLKADLSGAIKCFKNENVKQSEVFCFPGGYWNEEMLKVLKENNYLAAIGANRQTFLQQACPVIGRVGIHEDISQTLPMFKCRVWGKGLF